MKDKQTVVGTATPFLMVILILGIIMILSTEYSYLLMGFSYILPFVGWLCILFVIIFYLLQKLTKRTVYILSEENE